MAPVDPEEIRRRWERNVKVDARAQSAVRSSILAGVALAWDQMRDPFSPTDRRTFARAAAVEIRRGRQRMAGIMRAAIERAMIDAGLDPPRGGPVEPLPEPRGLPIEEVMERAPAQVAYEVTQGKPFEQAMRSGLDRALVTAEMDLATAARDSSRDTIANAPRIVGWRRMVRPYLSESGTCGLCLAAATRLYFKSDLMPLHSRCRCLPYPVIEGLPDIAQQINGVDIDDLYARAGETQRGKLARVRFKVVQHGELGPTLVDERHNFRGPGDLPGAA